MNGGWELILLQRAYLKALKRHGRSKDLWKLLRDKRTQLIAKTTPKQLKLI